MWYLGKLFEGEPACILLFLGEILIVVISISIAEDYNLELQYRKPFAEVWKEEKNHPVFGPLSERMGVRGRDAGPLLVSDEEMEAASMCLSIFLISDPFTNPGLGFYHAFCFYKV